MELRHQGNLKLKRLTDLMDVYIQEVYPLYLCGIINL